MKFGKEYKKQMVSEWTEAYMNYNGLKRILGEIARYKQSKQAHTHLKALQQKLALQQTFSGLDRKANDPSSEGDIEDQVIDVNVLRQDGSGQHYKTKFLRQSEEGGQIEVTFFKKLDEELNKVNNFYKDKVEEVMQEAALLNKQMDAFIALKIKVQNPDANNSSLRKCPSANMATTDHLCCPSSASTSGLNQIDAGVGVDTSNRSQLKESLDNGQGDAGEKMCMRHLERLWKCNLRQKECTGGPEISPVNSAATDCGEELNITEDKEDPLEILEHVKINNTLESPISTLKGVFKDSKDKELSFNKNELKRVEEKLRLVFTEFYQKLRLLKHYSFMNITAFSKIMKKYEKITSRAASRSYIQIVDNSYLGSSDEVNCLLERVEITFIKHFSNSNRREGMKSLRPKVKREKHSVTFFSALISSGFFSGCSIALLVAVVLRMEATKQMNEKQGALYMVNIFLLYSLFAYTVLHMLMYAANIYFWRRCRVNYPFIFGFKQGTELGYREVFLLSSGLSVLVLAIFLANLHLDMGSRTQNYKTVTELFPLALVSVVLIIIFCPFDIIYRSSRFFFIQSIFHCICAPLYKVTLPDFFLADHLTSQIQAIRSIELYICYYGLGEYSQRQNKCHSYGVYNVFYFIVAVIPYWLRFLQCLRRFCEDKDAIHAYNGLKYSLTIVAVVIRTAFELKKGVTWMVLALVSSVVATVMNTFWDIFVDWGLLRRHSKNSYLRDKLLVSHKSVYFVAMVLNVILRLAWLQLVLDFNLNSLHQMAITIVSSCLEIIRRGIWSFFRLENEHLNNVGKYRACKAVPYPFNYYDANSDKDD
ncbi:SPX domain-containing protein/EXS domain-containing protein [Cephalotus follicularis]|uniref:SPX domain-containing protein/EXS domain-containing protein n=1 Tax=Cephalotus follicularis TaxID=3775 RepID=A0A1Q3CGP9_CEPFO|nr:SPX domain-containing protein/EXS domain-containing protein [Cephalotus follicularis]